MVFLIQTFVPFGTKRLFTIKENKLDRVFWFQTFRHDASNFQRGSCAGATVVRSDKSEFLEKFCVVMTGDHYSFRLFAGYFADDVEHFDWPVGRVGFEGLRPYRQTIALQFIHDEFL